MPRFKGKDFVKYGIVGAGQLSSLNPAAVVFDEADRDTLAMDTALISVQNAGIPAMLTNYIDPNLIHALTAPMAATSIFPERKIGDVTTLTATFPFLEYTGETATYGDFSTTGMSSANANFPQRQQYRFQTNTVWGDIEAEMWAVAKINWSGEKQTASALTINRKFNRIYLYGVSGLQNYGLTNSPNLIATDVPVTVSGHTTWASKAAAVDPLAIFADFQKAIGLMITQSASVLNQQSAYVVGLPPSCLTYLQTMTTYGISVQDMVKKNYPNLEIVPVPEFESTGSGNLAYFAAKNVDGQPVGACGFAEKMRAHGVIRKESSYTEKKSAAAFGAAVFLPFGIVQLLGI